MDYRHINNAHHSHKSVEEGIVMENDESLSLLIQKCMWICLILLAAGLFVFSLLAQNVIYGAVSLVLALICEKCGYKALFAEFDLKIERKKRIMEEKKIWYTVKKISS